MATIAIVTIVSPPIAKMPFHNTHGTLFLKSPHVRSNKGWWNEEWWNDNSFHYHGWVLGVKIFIKKKKGSMGAMEMCLGYYVRTITTMDIMANAFNSNHPNHVSLKNLKASSNKVINLIWLISKVGIIILCYSHTR